MPPSFQALRCRHCGDVIGVYERLVLRAGGEVRETSRAAEPNLQPASAEHYHAACYAAFEDVRGGR